MKTNPLILLVLAAAGFAVSACALEASTDPVAAGSQPVYRTGSNIAARRVPIGSDEVSTLGRDEAERVLRPPATLPSRSAFGGG